MKHPWSAVLIGGIAAIVFGQIASAADLPTKGPVYKAPPPPPVFSWTGFYVGGNVGYSWGNASTDLNGSGVYTATNPAVVGAAFPSNFAFADSGTARPDGVIGGVQIGYNYQISPNWVLGLEADFQGSGERGSKAFADPFSTGVCVFINPNGTCDLENPGTLNGVAGTSYDAKIGWFGTVRGRVGYLITPQVLLYGTGGLAYGRVSVSGNAGFAGSIQGDSFPTISLPSASVGFSTHKTNVGFSVGAGIEGSVGLATNWTWKLEYLYLDLGSVDTAAPLSISSNATSTPISMTTAMHTHFTDNIVRVGLNYQFH
jgi:outer membrane immunogenic protein